MPNKRKPSDYTAYMLRCWLEGKSWRYSLEEVGSGKQFGFNGLDDFISFLLAREIKPGGKEKGNEDASVGYHAKP